MEWPVAKPIFRTSTDDHHLHGERSDRKRKATSFEFFASLFADDCAVLFESHEDMVIGMDYMYQHFLKFGLEIHLGRGTVKSKTEAMFFPKPRCDDGTTPPNFLCADGFISYTRLFKYLAWGGPNCKKICSKINRIMLIRHRPLFRGRAKGWACPYRHAEPIRKLQHTKWLTRRVATLFRVFIISNRPIWSELVSAKQGAGVTKTRRAP